MESRKHVLMAGGGTAGHVFPGLAVARELERSGWKVSWTGREQGMEERLVAAQGLDFHPLPARAVVGRNLLGKAAAGWTLARSTQAARRLIRQLDVDVVLGTGGYVSVPAVVGARLARRPSVLLEPNARAGAANRSLSRWSASAAIAYESSRPDFRCPAHLTGVPVRADFLEVPPPGDSLRILVLGGSQGALHLNRLLPAIFERLLPLHPTLRIVHQVGRHREATTAVYAQHGLSGTNVEIVPFIDDMAAAMADAGLVISRAGAVTLAEICAAGRPAILFPLALAGGHQRDNARELVEAGGAVMLDERSAPDEIAATVGRLLGDPEKRARMSAALSALARPDAAAAIADLLESAARGTRS